MDKRENIGNLVTRNFVAKHKEVEKLKVENQQLRDKIEALEARIKSLLEILGDAAPSNTIH